MSYHASIILPLRSQQTPWLEQALLSAVRQTVPVQVIVVVSPHTPAENLSLLRGMAREYPGLSWFERSPGAGFAGAINAGWWAAKADRLGLLLTDDWLSPDTIESCLAHDADMVCTGHIGYLADGEQVLWRRNLDRAKFDELPTLERKASYLTHFFLFRETALRAVGGVDEHIGNVGPDDYDLPWTLLEQDASVAFVDEPKYHYRDHHQERLTLRSREEQLKDLRKILLKHGVVEDEIQALMRRKAGWFGTPVHLAGGFEQHQPTRGD